MFLISPVWAQNEIETYAAPEGAPSGAKVSFQNRVYRVENQSPGSFSVRFPGLKQSDGTPLDAAQISRFSFDWKPSPSTKVNLFFKIAGRYYGAILSGPEAFRPGTVSWGRAIQTRQSDGFSRVEIPLRALAKSDNPGATTLPLEEILLGNWNNENYLMAGMGGNAVGDHYEIKNLAFVLGGSNTAPKIGQARFQNNDLLIPLQNTTGVETTSLELQVGEKKFNLLSPFLQLETTPDGLQTLRFRAGKAGFKLGEGESLSFALNNGVAAFKGEATFRLADLKTPPRPRLFRGETELQLGDFEDDNFGFSPNAAVADRVFDETRGGQVLRLTNPKTASRFDTLLRASLDVKQFPVLHFWYRADDRVRLDFRFGWNGALYGVRFLDGEAPARREGPNAANALIRLGAIEDARGDDSWREARFDLLAALKKQNPAAIDFKIQNLTLGDEGWMGNARGVQILLDDFAFVPALQAGETLRVEASDLSGLSEMAWAVEGDSTPANFFSNLSIPAAATATKTGFVGLQVVARNRAGRTGGVATFPLWIEAA